MLVIGDAATAWMVKRKLAADPSLNAAVVGRVAAQAPPTVLGDASRHGR